MTDQQHNAVMRELRAIRQDLSDHGKRLRRLERGLDGLKSDVDSGQRALMAELIRQGERTSRIEAR